MRDLNDTAGTAVGRRNVVFGWCWLLLGVVQAMLIGLFAFHDSWLGGYSSLPRRLLRLSHISFMALPLLNVLYGQQIDAIRMAPAIRNLGSYAMIVAGISMPTVCLLTAANPFFELFFFIPAGSFAIGIAIMACGQVRGFA